VLRKSLARAGTVKVEHSAFTSTRLAARDWQAALVPFSRTMYRAGKERRRRSQGGCRQRRRRQQRRRKPRGEETGGGERADEGVGWSGVAHSSVFFSVACSVRRWKNGVVAEGAAIVLAAAVTTADVRAELCANWWVVVP
jgi:hypothetical protein